MLEGHFLIYLDAERYHFITILNEWVISNSCIRNRKVPSRRKKYIVDSGNSSLNRRIFFIKLLGVLPSINHQEVKFLILFAH